MYVCGCMRACVRVKPVISVFIEHCQSMRKYEQAECFKFLTKLIKINILTILNMVLLLLFWKFPTNHNFIN